MRSSETLREDGFNLDEVDESELALGLLSLKVGLRAYFATYRSLPDAEFWNPTPRTEQRTLDYNHQSAYREAYAESILHLHHFFELLVKQMLRLEHPLLPLKAHLDHDIFCRILKGHEVADVSRINTVEFAEALKRLEALYAIDGTPTSAEPLIESAALLRDLNLLRNRLSHRGRFVLRSTAFDELIGGHVLAVIERVATLPPMSDMSRAWRYQPLACRVDPIGDIAAEYRRDAPRFQRIAILKELGRAAYENPVWPPLDGMSDELGKRELRERERWAKSEQFAFDGIGGPRVCPVCGGETLMGHFDYVGDDENYALIVYRVECLCCSFTLRREAGEPAALDLPIDTLWSVEAW